MKSEQIKIILIKMPCSVAVDLCGTHDKMMRNTCKNEWEYFELHSGVYKRDISNRLISMPKTVK